MRFILRRTQKKKAQEATEKKAEKLNLFQRTKRKWTNYKQKISGNYQNQKDYFASEETDEERVAFSEQQQSFLFRMVMILAVIIGLFWLVTAL